MYLKTKRKKLRIPPGLVEIDFKMKIMGETGDDFQLATSSGVIISLKKRISEINSLPISGKSIVLTETLYTRYVHEVVKKNDRAASDRLLNAFELVMTNQREVLNNPSFFLIRSNWLISGGSISGPLFYCLGSLIEAWLYDKRFTIHDVNGNKINVVKVGGSNLSGVIGGLGWDRENRRFVELDRRHLSGGLH